MSSFTVQGDSGSSYVVKDHGTHWSCSCMAWRFMGGPPTARVCKHISRHLNGTLGGSTNPALTMTATRKRKVQSKVDASAAKRPASGAPTIDAALATEWTSEDPTGYLISEKYDGMRVLWDGTTLWTRNHNRVNAPPELLRSLPSDTALDGELFMGRGRYQDCMKVVRCTTPSERDWSEIKFMVFDAPRAPGDALSRIVKAAEALRGNRWASVVQQTVCSDGASEVMDMLEAVVSIGGEGLILKHPTNPYTAGRNTNHLKVKRFYDADAIVVGYEPGKGKHTGRTGALKCMTSTGQTFKVGTGLTDMQRQHPPPIGSVVTYKYQNETDMGLPRFPVFMRVRQSE
jgi:DNA ligase-1